MFYCHISLTFIIIIIIIIIKMVNGSWLGESENIIRPNAIHTTSTRKKEKENTLLLLLLLSFKKVGSARLRESDIHPISPKTPALQYQPIDRKKRKRKRVENYSRDRAA